MKRIFTIAITLFITANLSAQAPEKMSYQAVIRNAGNTLVINTSVGMQISIIQGSPSGTTVYAETQTPSTNTNGLVSLEIGTGTIIIGDFTAIDWSNGPYFIKNETDPTGGTAYTITGTSQLLSVPYALFAKIADSISGGIVETDPIYNASDAFGITNSDITNWNNKLTSEVDGDVTNELQTLGILSDSLLITNGNKVSLNSLNTWKKGSYNSIFYDSVVVNYISPSLQVGFQTKLTASNNEELQGNASYLRSSPSHTNFLIGSKNIVSGIGTGPHIGVFGSGGKDVNYNIIGGARYGVHGMATDTLSSIVFNTGLYGFASGNLTSNYGVDGTAASIVGDNYANSGWAYGVTNGTNYGLYGYATSSTTSNYGVYGVIDPATTSPIKYSGYFKGAPLGVEDDNVYIKDFTKGVILTSPDGSCYQVKVDNSGNLNTTVVPCPN